MEVATDDVDMVDLVVKTLSNQQLQLLISPSSNVSELKSKVKELTTEKIAENRQRIIYRGQVLDDNNTLISYGISAGSVLHMVARPENFEELRNSPTPPLATSATAITSSSDVSDSIPNDATGVVNDLLSVLRGRSGMSASTTSIFEGMNSLDNNEGNYRNNVNSTSLEHTRQGILTINTILSSFRQSEEGNLVSPVSTNSSNPHRKRYYVGQWLDVKDTVSQWLEATVMALNEENGTIFVHYNGWPTRWDEWIDFDSPRIAPFRTRTSHSPLLSHLSPAPSVLLNNAPRTGSDDIRLLLPQISTLLHKILPAIDEAANLCNSSVEERNSHGYYTRHANSTNSVSPNMPWPNETTYYDRTASTCDLSEAEQQLNLLSSELSPLFDRLGRVMTDLSPHLREFHNRVPTQQPQTFPDHTLSSLLRTRAPSPPPENRFRELISTSRANAGRAGTFPGNHLDIHIAILSPSNHATNSENISQTVASLAARLQGRFGNQENELEEDRANEESTSNSQDLQVSDISDLPHNQNETEIESNNELKSTNDDDNIKDNDNDNEKANDKDDNNDNEKANDKDSDDIKDEITPSESESRRPRPLSFLERFKSPFSSRKS